MGEEFYAGLTDFIRRPAATELLLDVVLCAVPIWAAVMIGLAIGWSWKPRWTGLLFLGLRSKLRLAWFPPGFGARRVWFAFTALSAFSVLGKLWTEFIKGKRREGRNGDCVADLPAPLAGNEISLEDERNGNGENEGEIVTEKDLEHLLHLLDGKVGESAWQNQMERTTPNMLYQAWRYEPEDGPIVFKSRTVFEDASAELVRDFFWDDNYRLKWDAMLADFNILEENLNNGSMIVKWIKKFPFFCSDREYIIARRIWEQNKTFYCITKGIPYPSLPKREKPRRVELYFSSWRIRPVESRKKDGQLSSCEVTLVHYEDMGIPKDVAKLGVRHGMWPAVKKLHSGLRNYQNTPLNTNPNNSAPPRSRCAELAQITTKLEGTVVSVGEEEEKGLREGRKERNEGLGFKGGVDWRLVVIGGTVAVVCGLQMGLVGKALVFGAARRLARK